MLITGPRSPKYEKKNNGRQHNRELPYFILALAEISGHFDTSF